LFAQLEVLFGVHEDVERAAMKGLCHELADLIEALAQLAIARVLGLEQHADDLAVGDRTDAAGARGARVAERVHRERARHAEVRECLGHDEAEDVSRLRVVKRQPGFLAVDQQALDLEAGGAGSNARVVDLDVDAVHGLTMEQDMGDIREDGGERDRPRVFTHKQIVVADISRRLIACVTKRQPVVVGTEGGLDRERQDGEERLQGVEDVALAAAVGAVEDIEVAEAVEGDVAEAAVALG
jgi:hypothetical protein